MTKISKRFILYLSTLVILLLAMLIFINVKFTKRFYTYIKKQEIAKISNELIYNTSDENIEKIEENEKVVIVKIDASLDVNKINEQIRTEFLNKGLGLEKYWLWEEDYNTTIKDGSKIRIYRQDRLNYSLLVRYLNIEDSFIAVAMIIPSISEIVKIINIISIFIFVMLIFFIIIIVLYLVHKITNPIFKICETTKEISRQNFNRIDIKTNDEIEILASNINAMSFEIEKYQKSIIEKNKDIEGLLNALTHDLKTPIALIKLYSKGIEDGLDDGTFLSIIIEQNEKINHIVSKLLDLFKVKQIDARKEDINISDLLFSIIKEQEINLSKFNTNIEIKEDIYLFTNLYEAELLIKNLLTNSIKYATKDYIEIYLDENLFYTINYFDDSVDFKEVFKEFYVGEKSRNKEMSGTGLGLAIVKSICNKNNYNYGKEKDYLDINIKSLTDDKNEFVFPYVRGDNYILPFGEGKYINKSDNTWKKYLNDADFKGIENLSMQFFSVEQGNKTLTYIIKNPYNNNLMFNTKENIEFSFKHTYPVINKNKEYGFRVYISDNSILNTAKIYKSYLEEQGIFKTLKEKEEQNPDIAKLYGAVHIYFWDRNIMSKDDIKWNKFKNKLDDKTIGYFSKLLSENVKDGKDLAGVFNDIKDMEFVDNYNKNRVLKAFYYLVQIPNLIVLRYLQV